MVLTLIAEVKLPPPGIEYWQSVDPTVVRALDAGVFSFARWMQQEDAPRWIIQGSKLFNSTAEPFPLAPCYNALQGYHAGLKACAAGLVFVADMSVTCFLAGGDLVAIMGNALGFPTPDAFLNEIERNKGLDRRAFDTLNDVIKNSKCRLKHLGHTKKIKWLGPAPGSPESAFDLDDGKKSTVAAYFEKLAKERPEYKSTCARVLHTV